VVKETGGAIAIVLVIAGAAVAQQPSAPVPAGAPSDVQLSSPVVTPPSPSPTIASPAAPSAAAPATPQAATADVRPLTPAAMRQQMALFCNALSLAIRNGASSMEQKVRQVLPTAKLAFSSPTQVTSHRLPDYGPEFQVGVPDLSPNTEWALAILMGQQQRVRQRVFQAPGPGQVQGATVNRTALAGDPQVVAPPPPPTPFVDRALLPEELYTSEVKNAIIEAMVENSQGLHLTANERLTVVARSNAEPDPQSLSPQTDATAVTFQIMGADLLEYHTGRITPEDVRRRVKITED
jgi:hypothetical protein